MEITRDRWIKFFLNEAKKGKDYTIEQIDSLLKEINVEMTDAEKLYVSEELAKINSDDLWGDEEPEKKTEERQQAKADNMQQAHDRMARDLFNVCKAFIKAGFTRDEAVMLSGQYMQASINIAHVIAKPKHMPMVIR